MMQRLVNNEAPPIYGGVLVIYMALITSSNTFFALQVGTTECDTSAFGFCCKRILWNLRLNCKHKQEVLRHG